MRVQLSAALPLTLLALLVTLCLPAASTAQEPAPPGFFGVNVSSNRPTDFGEMAAANVGVARTIFPFQVIKQERRGPYTWGYSDDFVRRSAENGIDLIPILYGSPPWISQKLNRTPLRGAAKRAWAKLLTSLVTRYGPGGNYWAENPSVPYHPIVDWQIWNEPNSITWWGPRPRPSEYATLLRRSARAIRSVDPNARIMTAGIVARPTNNRAIPGKKYLRALFRQPGVVAATDIVAYHPFAPSVAGVQRQLEVARKILRHRHAGEIPIWITEIGWGAQGPRDHPLIKSARGQNRALRQTLEMAVAARERLGIQRLLWYQWHDGRDDLCLWCESSGLVDGRSQPKGLLDTFRSIARR